MNTASSSMITTIWLNCGKENNCKVVMGIKSYFEILLCCNFSRAIFFYIFFLTEKGIIKKRAKGG